MSKMRAKMNLNRIELFENSERLHFNAVCKPNGYPADGYDEDNTYAKWTPQAELSIALTNTELLGTFKVGDKYYIDFTHAE